MNGPFSAVKPIAFYLPQFYETPYNSEWWGEGFTEWTAARRGEPMFAGHHQPQLPLTGEDDLGFHDQTELATLEAQAALAKAYGVYGFCHYFYWFGGKRVLEKPTELMLANPSVDIPFCLSWANENWSRRWDGGEADILIPQNYDPETYADLAADLAPYFSDPRYITSGGEALFLIYRPGEIPELARLVEAIKAQAKSCGHKGAMVLGTETFIAPGQQSDPRAVGLDGAVEFPPHSILPRQIHTLTREGETDFGGMVVDHASAISATLRRPSPDYPLFRGVFPAWDNTARRGRRATIFAGSSPALFGHWLYIMSDWTQRRHSPEMQFIFINAWNEWAEGAHLEPDELMQDTYLNTIKDVLNGTETPQLSFDWTKASPEYIENYSRDFESKFCSEAFYSHEAGPEPDSEYPYQLKLSGHPARQNEGYYPAAQPWREHLKKARSFRDVKTALWMAGYHDYPQTRWQRFTTAAIRKLSKTG